MLLKDFNKILVILSTASRNYEKINTDISNKLNQLLPKEKFEIIKTVDENSNHDFTKEFISKNKHALIIAVGGDGSLSEVSEAIYQSNRDDIYFSFLPNGTGNDFSRTIYPNMSINEIINRMDNFEFQKVDLVKVNDRTSINSIAFGFESLILENSLIIKKKFPFLSKLSFYLGIFATLTKLKPIEYKYSLKYDDGSFSTGKTRSIINSLNNNKYYGGGFMPSPTAKIDDGVIDFNYVDYIGVFRLVSLLGKFRKGKHVDLDISHDFKVVSGTIEMPDNKIVTGNIDGNLYKFNKIDFNILPAAIKLVKFTT